MSTKLDGRTSGDRGARSGVGAEAPLLKKVLMTERGIDAPVERTRCQPFGACGPGRAGDCAAGTPCPRACAAFAASLSGLRRPSLVKMLKMAPLPPATKSPVMTRPIKLLDIVQWNASFKGFRFTQWFTYSQDVERVTT